MINQKYDLMDSIILKEFVCCGYDCSIVRYCNHFCGYVEVPKNHALYGKNWNDDIINDINVHGGITYNRLSDNDTWRFGWDSAHVGDFCIFEENDLKKYLKMFIRGYDDKLWFIERAMFETINLARQLKKLE